MQETRPYLVTNFDDPKNRWIMIVTGLLLVFAVFLNLGIHPLSMEEPRRALIALEMRFNDNFWVPTLYGEPYYRKPPLFNWLIHISYELFGSYSEFATRFLSVLSYLLTGWVCYWFGKRFINATAGFFAAILFLVSNDLLFYYTLIAGEVDLFYTLVTYLGLLSIFYFGERKQYYALFVSVYVLGAIGTLTKGLPTPVFIAISLTAYFVAQKEFRKLLSVPHVLGILIYAGIIGGYLWQYSQYLSLEGFFLSENSLIAQSAERTVVDKGISRTIMGIVSFPLMFLKVLAPASLLVPFMFRKDLLPLLKSHRYVWFCSLLFAANIVIYWISPGTASRYLYVFFPLTITVLFYVFSRTDNIKWLRIVDWAMVAIMVLLMITCAAIPFVPALEGVSRLWTKTLGAMALFSGLLWLYRRFATYRLILFLVALIGARIIFDLVILPQRSMNGQVFEDKKLAYDILDLTDGEPVKMWGSWRISRTTLFYLERETEQVIPFGDGQNPELFYVAKWEEVSKYDPIVLHRFHFRGDAFALIRFRSP